MWPDPQIVERLRARLDEAIDCAVVQGLVKYAPGGGLQPAPFALVPCPIAPGVHEAMRALTVPFNRLAHAVSRDTAFLEEALAPAARVDPFTARLLAVARAGRGTQPLFLAATRSDYFVHAPDAAAPPAVRQVELNTISASYPGLAAAAHRLHRYLLRGEPAAGRLLPNDPVPVLAETFAEAHARYGRREAVVLMVVQPGESNVFDQRFLEFALRERGLVTRRMSLEQIGREGRLAGGHLVVRGETAAITYLRAAYGPEDFPDEDAWRARELIEASSTISVPGLRTQLAGTKKVQQVLSRPGVLERFLSPDDAAAVRASFAGQYDLEQALETPRGPRPAWEVALERPAGFVLKPQREGGGHNHFDEALQATLRGLDAGGRAAYILMERIRPPARRSVLVRGGEARAATVVSEIGRFGAYLAQDGREVHNRDAGYLVRTKEHGTQEGGISAGFGFLDSLVLEPS